MKMKLSNVSITGIAVVNSKKNSGGAVCRIQMSVNLTKSARKALGIGDEQEWPPSPESAGKIRASFDATRLVLKAKQGNTLGEPEELDIAITLADGWRWKMEDPKDETNTTVEYTFSARTADEAAALLAVGYKFSASSADSTGELFYNKPGDGTQVDMSNEDEDSAQPLLDGAEAAEEGDGEGIHTMKRGRGRPRKDATVQ
jgi:hypothetical protein